MSDSKHTPGPWSVTVSGDADGLPGIHAFGYGIDICEVWGTGQADVVNPECEANARLIAAAPELLSALEEILDSYNAFADLSVSGSTNCLVDDPEVVKARAAIAKAKGEPNE